MNTDNLSEQDLKFLKKFSQTDEGRRLIAILNRIRPTKLTDSQSMDSAVLFGVEKGFTLFTDYLTSGWHSLDEIQNVLLEAFDDSDPDGIPAGYEYPKDPSIKEEAQGT